MISRRKAASSRAVTYKGYFLIPDVMLTHPDFTALSGSAVKMLCALGAQYNGYNNGDLCVSLKIMKRYGWKSNNGITRAKRELIERSWIMQTKQGGLGIGPDLFAITWQPIDECKGKLDVRPTEKPPRSLKERGAHESRANDADQLLVRKAPDSGAVN